ncbi:unnamed protein product, partial [Rotaria sp. Silwood1]
MFVLLIIAVAAIAIATPMALKGVGIFSKITSTQKMTTPITTTISTTTTVVTTTRSTNTTVVTTTRSTNTTTVTRGNST